MAVESLGPGSAGEGETLYVLSVFLACVYPELWLVMMSSKSSPQSRFTISSFRDSLNPW